MTKTLFEEEIEDGTMWMTIDEPYMNPPWENLKLDFTRKNPYVEPIFTTKFIGLHLLYNEKGITTVECSEGNFEFESFFNFVETLSNLPEATFIVYNPVQLDILLKTIGQDKARDLLIYGTVLNSSIQIWFTPNRTLTLKYRNKRIRILSIYEWFRGETLEEVLIRYNINGPSLVKRLVSLITLLSIQLSNLKGLGTGNISSPSVITNLILNPPYNSIDAASIPEDAYRFAYQSFHAPWIEMHQTGSFRNIYDYDINAAYPSAVKKLLNIDKDHGYWEFKEGFDHKATYGFCLAIITIDNNVKVSPIQLRKNGGLFTVKGTWVGHITKEEVNFIHKHRLGRVQVLSGWYFHVTVIQQPFKKEINHFLKIRQKAINANYDLLNHAIKAATARFVGKFLQKNTNPLGDRYPEASGTFNPIYATIAMTDVKLRVAELALMKPDAVLNIIVDGLALSEPLPIKSSNKMGEVRLNAQTSGIVVSPFMTWFTHNKKPFLVANLFKENPGRSWYTLPHVQMHRICESVTFDVFNRIGNIKQEETILEIGKDHKRSWIDKPQTGADMLWRSYKSEIHSVDFLEMRHPSFIDGQLDYELKLLLEDLRREN